MRNFLALRNRCVAAAAFVLTSAIAPAVAQVSGDTANYVSATFAAPLARYYAPYALQAAAAYESVVSLDAARGSPDGADVAVALTKVGDTLEDKARAAKYLRPWRYQFGHEGYLTCFESDPECGDAIGRDRWTFAIGTGPAFQVWARTRYPYKEGAACSEVSIAFRGTTLSMSDWLANLDPVTGYLADDHYRQLRRNIDAIIKKITTLDCYRRARNRPQIVSVGHSLGGGLAQMAALANNPSRPRIAKVFAFDPSPVTGASYVDKSVLAQNVAGLEIDRVYQSREVLQALRKFYQQPPKQGSPCVRYVAYDYYASGSPTDLHTMSGLAGQMVKSTYEDDDQIAYRLPKRLPNCPSRYTPPLNDNDDDGALAQMAQPGASRTAAGALRTRAARALPSVRPRAAMPQTAALR